MKLRGAAAPLSFQLSGMGPHGVSRCKDGMDILFEINWVG